jgi:hypothetical protein
VLICDVLQTGLSHACGNGFMPILQLLDGVEEIDPNLPDNDGNTPLIFAAQAGQCAYYWGHVAIHDCIESEWICAADVRYAFIRFVTL